MSRDGAGIFYSLGCLLLDVCSVGALVAGLVSARLPAGLAIGYTATAVAMLSFLGGVNRHFCQGPGGLKRQKCCCACLVATSLALVVLTVFVVAREQ